MKRLALAALLLASSSLMAAPAPLPKPQRKAERHAAWYGALVVVEFGDDRGIIALPLLPAAVPVAPVPSQPPSADPPG